jgi:hypothetical protein
MATQCHEFQHLHGDRVKRGVLQSVNLKAAINCFVADTNANPKPFVWTAESTPLSSAIRIFVLEHTLRER